MNFSRVSTDVASVKMMRNAVRMCVVLVVRNNVHKLHKPAAALSRNVFARRFPGLQRRFGGAAAHKVARGFCGMAATTQTGTGYTRMMFGWGLVAGALLQLAFGNRQKYAYEYRFTTKTNPEDMAEFYGAEDFMEIFGVFPFLAKFFLRMAQFDESGVAHTYGLPGALDIKLTFDQDEEDTNGDGEPDTIVGFNKKMEWDNVEPFSGASLWEMDHDFGFRQVDDDTYEVYHKGTDFVGPYPLMLIWRLHAWYVSKATQLYVDDPRFSEEDADEKREHLRNRLVLEVSKDAVKDIANAVRCNVLGTPDQSLVADVA